LKKLQKPEEIFNKQLKTAEKNASRMKVQQKLDFKKQLKKQQRKKQHIKKLKKTRCCTWWRRRRRWKRRPIWW
jgi:hypothetical protein